MPTIFSFAKVKIFESSMEYLRRLWQRLARLKRIFMDLEDALELGGSFQADEDLEWQTNQLATFLNININQ